MRALGQTVDLRMKRVFQVKLHQRRGIEQRNDTALTARLSRSSPLRTLSTNQK